MPRLKDLDLCEFYACKNPQHDDVSAVVTVQLPGEDPVKVNSCLYHSAILGHGSEKYSIGRTYTGEIELRPIAAQFAAPAPTPPAE